jgi:hypothetical protein
MILSWSCLILIYSSSSSSWRIRPSYLFSIRINRSYRWYDSLDGGSDLSQGRYLHMTTRKQNKHTQTSMPHVGFEPTIPAYERALTFHALDRAATVISWFLFLYLSLLLFFVYFYFVYLYYIRFILSLLCTCCVSFLCIIFIPLSNSQGQSLYLLNHVVEEDCLLACSIIVWWKFIDVSDESTTSIFRV